MKRMEWSFLRLAALIALAAIYVPTAHAQQIPPDDDDWNFRIGIPLWASGTHGTIGASARAIVPQGPNGGPIGGPGSATTPRREVHLNQSFTDFFGSLDFAAALDLEVRKGRWLLFSDGEGFKISETGQVRGQFQGASAEVAQTLAFDDLAIGYNVVKLEDFSLHLFAGAQLSYAALDLSLNLPVTDRTASASQFWADPIIGVYLNYQFSKPAGFYTKADVGGFGVSSRLIWQVEGGFEFPVTDYFYIRAAYRCMAVDYQKKVSLDIVARGPQLELGFRF